jgi:hypothetical protein
LHAADKPQQHPANKNIFIDVITSKPSVYVGETLTVQYLLYFSAKITDPENDLDINFKNCYVETYPVTPQPDKVINGKSYHVILLQKALVIPQFAGTLSIPVISIKLKIDQPAAKNDFFGTEQSVEKTFLSPSKQVNVLVLPALTEALSFSGAVGRFKLAYKFTPSAKTPNLLNVKFNMTGAGNVKSAHWMLPEFPQGINVFNITNKETNALIEDNIKTNHTFSFDLVANYKGGYTIPAVTFLAFDPDSAKYVKYQTAPYQWDVGIGPVLPANMVKAAPVPNEKPFLYTKKNMDTPAATRLFFGSAAFYILISMAIILFVTGSINNYNNKIKEANPALYNFKMAKKQAINKIQKLRLTTDGIEDAVFYKSLDEILQAYLCYKTGTAFHEFSFEQIIKRLKVIPVPDEQLAEATLYIKQQYTKRFSPVVTGNYTRDVACSQLLQIVNGLDIYMK